MRADATRNHEAIVRAASELVERNGVEVPLDDIARAAGVGPGTLHRHFATKESLLAEIVRVRLAELADRLGALTGGRWAARPGTALRRGLELLIDEGDRSASVKAALSGDLALAAVEREARDVLADALGRLLAAAAAADEVRPGLTLGDAFALVAGAYAAAGVAGPGRPARRRARDLVLGAAFPRA